MTTADLADLLVAVMRDHADDRNVVAHIARVDPVTVWRWARGSGGLDAFCQLTRYLEARGYVLTIRRREIAKMQ